MELSAGPVASGLALLTILASIAEIVLASWVLYDLHVLHDEVNYSFNGMQSSSQYPTIPDPVNDSYTFYQPWVFEPNSNLWALPGVQLAAGVSAFAFGILTCTFVYLRFWSSRKSGPGSIPSYAIASRVAVAVLVILTIAITALFIYATSDAASRANLHLDGALGGAGYDAAPTWEEWACAVSSFLEQHTSVPAARSEWKTICQVNRGARWTLIPVEVLTLGTVVTFLSFWFRSTATKANKEDIGTGEMELE